MSRLPVARASIQAVISKPCMGPQVRALSTRTSRVPRRMVSGSPIRVSLQVLYREWDRARILSSDGSEAVRLRNWGLTRVRPQFPEFPRVDAPGPAPEV